MALNARSHRPNGSRPFGLPYTWRLVLFAALLGALLGGVLVLPLVPAAVGQDVREGFPAPYTLTSPVTTRYVSQILTRADREAAAKAVADVYRFDPTITVQARQALSDTLEIVEPLLYAPTYTTSERLEHLARIEELSLTSEMQALLLDLSLEDWRAIEKEALRLYDLVTYDQFNVGQVRQLRAQDLDSVRQELTRKVSPTFSMLKRQLIEALIDPFLVPNYVVDVDETARRREEAQAKTPPHYVDVLEGELIVYEGQIVREEDLEKMEAAGLRRPLNWTVIGGQVLLVEGLIAAFSLFLFRFQEKTSQDLRSLLLIGLVMLVAALGAKFLVPGRVGFAYAFPLPTAALLLTLLLSPQVALAATVVLSVLVGLLGGGSLELAVLGLTGGLVGILSIWKAQRSTAFLFAGFAITLANLVIVGGFRLVARDWTLSSLGTAALACAINGFASAALGFASFGLLGSLFGRVTVLQLLELSSPSHPLLRRLMQEAPGTYYHSIIVGNLAERAAEVIGADPLLVRVGAYYHDIGKLVRPYFFIDNQAGRSNIHDELPPSTSARIVTDHVADGIELARKYRLPEQIVEFIPQHHGTTLAAYFYRRALQEDETVNADDFRYPGPRPRSREAAILMLADSVEAKIRAMSQAGKLREALEANKEHGGDPLAKLVAETIEERVRDGQLEESDLAFRDLKAIQQAFVDMLRGVYHPRVEYPEIGQPAKAS